MKNIYLLLFLFLFSCSQEEHKDDVIDTQATEISASELYKNNCKTCHGMDGKLGFSGAKDLTKSVLTLTEIEHQIANGKGAMAGYKNLLTTQEIKKIAAYAYEFRNKK